MSHEHEPGSAECRELFAQLSEYIDGELDPEDCEKIDGHVEGCRPCVAFLESLRRTVRAVGSMEPPKLTESERRRVLEQYRRMRDRDSGA